MNLLEFSISSERLKLIPTSLVYAQDIFSEFTKELTVFMYPKPATKIEETISFIQVSQEKMKNNEALQVVILEKDTDEFLGHGGIHGLKSDTPELGIWIKKSAHGKKYGREAVTALKKWIDTNLKYKFIKYPVDRRNIASRKIAESLGGMVGAEYKKISMTGNELHEVEYRIYKKN